MNFIGIDLAWSEYRPSGIATLCLRGGRLELSKEPRSVTGVEAVWDAIELREASVVAIDAPLVITNQGGQRRCEKEISQSFSRFHAGAHSSNLKAYPHAPSVALAERLAAAGYLHFPVADRAADHVMLEVYPHPALVVLFNLSKIVRYKKGSVGAKRLGLGVLQSHLLSLNNAELPLATTEILRAFLDRKPNDLRGKTLKDYEDRVDALICAYIAAFSWHWSSERVKIFGGIEDGYVVVPTHTAGGARWKYP